MKDIKQSLEDNYLTFISITAASAVFIAAIVWVVTVFVKKLKNK